MDPASSPKKLQEFKEFLASFTDVNWKLNHTQYKLLTDRVRQAEEIGMCTYNESMPHDIGGDFWLNVVCDSMLYSFLHNESIK